MSFVWSQLCIPDDFERFGSEALVEAQKRHRPVTVCCTFRPDTGMIS